MIPQLARFTARTFFKEIVLVGTENLPQSGPVIFTPNHPNGLIDPLLLFFISPPFRLRFVAKAPLFKVPVFGQILRSIGAIPVVRKFEATGNVDYTAFFAKCVDALERGDSIVIFPEGRSLPQAYLAPLKTGPARLFLMAREKQIPVKIVPVGLNYEQGSTFRSDVLVCLAPPVDVPEKQTNVSELTEQIKDSLNRHVVQAETYREKELLALLERLYASGIPMADEMERLARLKGFEQGLSRLRNSTAATEIDILRKLLTRYERLSRMYGIESDALPPSLSLQRVAFLILGGIVAFPGVLLNFLPYHLCDLLIRATKRDASETATFKVIYSLFLFPLFYALEGYLLHRYAGEVWTLLFALLVLPLSYFTLIYREWFESNIRGILWGDVHRRAKQLERLRKNILMRVNRLRAFLAP